MPVVIGRPLGVERVGVGATVADPVRSRGHGDDRITDLQVPAPPPRSERTAAIGLEVVANDGWRLSSS
jgi:hypothetical protein